MMEIKRNTIEPFTSYPESLIDSKEKAVKVIKDNAYYFYVIGIFSLFAGAFFLNRNEKSFDISFGLEVLITGTLYIVLAYLTSLTKSRITATFLAIIIIVPFFISAFQDYKSAFSFFKLLLCFSAYRTLKATWYYNKY